jgi:hypothetical protein
LFQISSNHVVRNAARSTAMGLPPVAVIAEG